jgi:hypothetical protein
MTDDPKLLDTPLPFPLMYRPDEHPDALRMMISGRQKVPQLLKLWMNFNACIELHSKLQRGVIFMEKGPSGIYMLEIPAWRMHQGYEPKLVETPSSLVVPGGAPAAAVAAEETKKEDEKEKENGNEPQGGTERPIPPDGGGSPGAPPAEG